MRSWFGRASHLAALVLVATTVVVVSSCGLVPSSTSLPGSTTGASSGSRTAAADLPAEARETLAAIDRGGPYPFAQDGATFHNREGLLPARPDGYYREFTVVTPGSPDRGARRIVAGDGGERYYTNDHYASFTEVTQ
ncbi:MAG: ribonuclease N1 [Actinomycetota bacterium]|nr:ribonuclease N1 [Actinomycetota bacterium]